MCVSLFLINDKKKLEYRLLTTSADCVTFYKRETPFAASCHTTDSVLLCAFLCALGGAKSSKVKNICNVMTSSL